MEWRLTFFVESAERRQHGWQVAGESGLGPPQMGDTFSFVQHQDTGREDWTLLRVVEADERFLVLEGGTKVDLRRGDILGGEVQR